MEMPLEKFDYRQHRGFEIASRQPIREIEIDSKWKVPTQDKNNERGKNYTVINDSGKFRCDCGDHVETQSNCKHIWAVHFHCLDQVHRGRKAYSHFVDEREKKGIPTRSSYPRNWAAYRKVRKDQKELFLSMLADLVEFIPPMPRKRGRGIDLRSAIVAIVMKVYEAKSADIFMGDYRDARRRGITKTDCCSNTILNYMGRADIEPILKHLIGVSCLPLAEFEDVIAVDSTGFTTSLYTSFFDVKYRGKKEKRYLTAHMGCGVKTKIITAVEISSQADPVMFPTIFHQSKDRVKVKEVLADRAYSADHIHELVAANKVRAYIEHKVSDKGVTTGNAFKESVRFFKFNKAEFYQHYGRRSLVESAFSMMKRNFGPHLRSRTETAMKNEVLCKVLCHNIACLLHAMETFDITLDVWKTMN